MWLVRQGWFSVLAGAGVRPQGRHLEARVPRGSGHVHGAAHWRFQLRPDYLGPVFLGLLVPVQPTAKRRLLPSEGRASFPSPLALGGGGAFPTWPLGGLASRIVEHWHHVTKPGSASSRMGEPYAGSLCPPLTPHLCQLSQMRSLTWMSPANPVQSNEGPAQPSPAQPVTQSRTVVGASPEVSPG